MYIKGNINNISEMIGSLYQIHRLTFRCTPSIYSIFWSSDIKNEKFIFGTLGIFVGSSPYFILDVLFRVKSPKTTYTRIYGCYSGLLGGSRIRCREWFVDKCVIEENIVAPWFTRIQKLNPFIQITESRIAWYLSSINICIMHI